MNEAPRILAFAGSTRRASVNKKLARVAAEATRRAGGEVTLIDLRDFPMPLYDGDLEADSGLPEHALRLRALLYAHRGLLIAAPEYNSSITAVLKNAIDWCSRPHAGEPMLACFKGKIAALCSASPGGWGGMRGLVVVRMLLGNIGVHVLPTQVCVARSGAAFDESGALVDEGRATAVERLAGELVDATRRLSA